MSLTPGISKSEVNRALREELAPEIFHVNLAEKFGLAGEIMCLYSKERDVLLVGGGVGANGGPVVYRSLDEGLTWEKVLENPAGTTTYVKGGIVTRAGTAILGLNGGLLANCAILRSTDWRTFTNVYPTGFTGFRGWNFCLDANGYIYAAEYGSGRKVIRSVDDGQTWATVADLSAYDAAHCHSIAYDFATDKFWVTMGDTNRVAIETTDWLVFTTHTWGRGDALDNLLDVLPIVTLTHHVLIIGTDVAASYILKIREDFDKSQNLMVTNPQALSPAVRANYVWHLYQDGPLLLAAIRGGLLGVSKDLGDSWAYMSVGVDPCRIATSKRDVYVSGCYGVTRIPKRVLLGLEPHHQTYEVWRSRTVAINENGSVIPLYLWKTVNLIGSSDVATNIRFYCYGQYGSPPFVTKTLALAGGAAVAELTINPCLYNIGVVNSSAAAVVYLYVICSKY